MEVLLAKLPEDIVYQIILPYTYCPQSDALMKDLRDYRGSIATLLSCAPYPAKDKERICYYNMGVYLYWHLFPSLVNGALQWNRMRMRKGYHLLLKDQCTNWLRRLHTRLDISARFRVYWGMLSPHEREVAIRGICIMNQWSRA